MFGTSLLQKLKKSKIDEISKIKSFTSSKHYTHVSKPLMNADDTTQNESVVKAGLTSTPESSLPAGVESHQLSLSTICNSTFIGSDTESETISDRSHNYGHTVGNGDDTTTTKSTQSNDPAFTNFHSTTAPVKDVSNTTAGTPPSKRRRQECAATPTTATATAQLKTSEKHKSATVFGIVPLLLIICSYCDIFDVIRYRRINSTSNRRLSFSFDCQYYQVFFKYSKNKPLSDLIKHQICDNLSSLCKWYLMLANYRVSWMLFLPDPSQQAIEFGGNDENEHKIDLFRMKLDFVGLCSSQVKEIKDKVLSNDWDDTQGQLPIRPIQQLFEQLKSIDKCVKSNNWESNVCKQIPDWFILAEMFSIKPLSNKLLQLIKNESFRNFLKYSKFNGSMDRRMFASYQDNCTNCALSFFWKSLSLANVRKKAMENVYFDCFSWIDKIVLSHPKGKYAFFSDLACCGNFSYYDKFMNYHKGDKESQLSDCSKLRHGILVMFGAFLKINLLKQFSCDCGERLDCDQMMVYVLNPGQLQSFKNALTWPPTSLINITNIDGQKVINHHPTRRLEFMWQLCFSTRFARELVTDRMYRHWRKWIIDSYSSFDYFVKFWCLNEYSDLKKNKLKQERIHFQFKLIVQYMLGLSSFCKDVEPRIKATNALSGYKEHLFVNIKPKNEFEVSLLYDVMVQNHTEQQLLESLQHPQIDHNFCDRPRVICDKYMEFDAVDDACQFMKDVFNLFG